VPVTDAVVINGAPLLAPLVNQTVDAGALVQFAAVAIDPGDVVVFSLIGAPAGATIDAAAGAFTWTPTQVQAPGTRGGPQIDEMDRTNAAVFTRSRGYVAG